MTDPKQFPYCLNWLGRNKGDRYFEATYKNFKTIGEAFRFIRELKASTGETVDRYLYKREGRRGFDFVNEY